LPFGEAAPWLVAVPGDELVQPGIVEARNMSGSSCV
jgi:hypothetical protein